MYLIDFKSLFMNPMDLLWYARFGLRVQFHNDHVEHYIEDDIFLSTRKYYCTGSEELPQHRAMRSDFSVSFQFLFSFFSVSFQFLFTFFSVRDDNIFSP
jgi:hypothetical protein